MKEIGSIYANNIEDRESIKSMEFGFIGGDGLIGKVVKAVRELEDVAIENGYYCGSEYRQGEAFQKLKEARVAFYKAMKNLEREIALRESLLEEVYLGL